MLKRLVVSNFAIIENIDIEFKDGLTVLTGETGAGKSLIIDSLSLLLGERAQVEMVRTGFDKAEITGYFSFDSIQLNACLNNMGIKVFDNEIKIYRSISQSKSYIKINDVTITLQDLKKVSKYLADIHMQFDVQKILNQENYLEIIDGFKYDLTKEYLNNYLELLSLFKAKKKEYNDCLLKAKEIEKNRDMYMYHLKEIEGLNLSVKEESEIEEKIDFLKNYDKIYSILEETNALIREDFIDKLYEVKDNLERLSEYQKSYSLQAEKLNDYYYEIDSVFSDIKKGFERIDYNPNELTELETRQNEIDQAKKKYKMNVEELLEYSLRLRDLLSINENYDEIIGSLRKDLEDLYIKTYNKGIELTKIRKEISLSIEKELEKNMKDLSLKARFKVDLENENKEADFEGSIFKDNGIDNVDFLIETNIGEGLKPLSKTVSGGEASRIMLALKALFIKSQKISTVIFDEIDTGISGEVARKVALKIYEISLTTQVISITHLPQVASMSKNHLRIGKEIKNDRTFTNVKELSLDEKIYEIASMISGGKVTDSQIEYAKEMIMMK